jgi:hypothetical protein
MSKIINAYNLILFVILVEDFLTVSFMDRATRRRRTFFYPHAAPLTS